MDSLCLPQSISAKVCSDIQIKVAATRRERHDAFELVYRAYRARGYVAKTTAACGTRRTNC